MLPPIHWSQMFEEEINVDQSHPLKVNDHWRKLLFTAFLQSYICKQQGDCIYNQYDLSNIGVIKLRGSSILGFKRFERIRGMKNINHDAFIRFVNELFAELCGPLALQQVSDLDNFLGVLGADRSHLKKVCDPDGPRFVNGLPDICMLHNPVFLDEEEMASFYGDSYRLVRHQFYLRNAGRKAANILRDMEICWNNDRCVDTCQQSPLLKHLLGRHEKTAEGIKRFKEPRAGSAVMDIPRHAVTHCIEMDVLQRAREECTTSAELDVLDKFPREEAIEAVRHRFDLLPQVLVCSFLANREWPSLRLEERLPLPSIFGYLPPKQMGWSC